MANKNLIAILRSRGAPFTPEEMGAMKDTAAWEWIYAHDAAKPKKVKRPEVCFTGFTAQERQALAALASAHGYAVKGSVTTTLALLVTGLTPGPSKIATAEERDIPIMDEAGFRASLLTLSNPNQ